MFVHQPYGTHYHCPIRLSPTLATFKPVLDLWENQRGVSNVFLTYFDYFFGGQYKLEVVERHQMGFKVGIHSRGSNRSEYEPGSVTNEN